MVAFRDEGIKIFYSIFLALFVVKAWQSKIISCCGAYGPIPRPPPPPRPPGRRP